MMKEVEEKIKAKLAELKEKEAAEQKEKAEKKDTKSSKRRLEEAAAAAAETAEAGEDAIDSVEIALEDGDPDDGFEAFDPDAAFSDPDMDPDVGAEDDFDEFTPV
jgi:hypothetical protein